MTVPSPATAVSGPAGGRATPARQISYNTCRSWPWAMDTGQTDLPARGRLKTPQISFNTERQPKKVSGKNWATRDSRKVVSCTVKIPAFR